MVAKEVLRTRGRGGSRTCHMKIKRGVWGGGGKKMGKRNGGESQPKLSMYENDIRKPAILNAKIFLEKESNNKQTKTNKKKNTKVCC